LSGFASALRRTRDRYRVWRDSYPRARSSEPHALPARLTISLAVSEPFSPLLDHAIRSLLHQTIRPDRVILWVEPRDLQRLPGSTLALQHDGLSIMLCEAGLGPHKKIIPAVEQYPNSYIVVADDRMMYPPYWLEGLVRGVRPGLKEVLFYRGRRLNEGPDDAGASGSRSADGIGTGEDDLMPIGRWGVLYPPAAFDPRTTDRQLLLGLAPEAEDLWLYCMARAAGTAMRPVLPPDHVYGRALPAAPADGADGTGDLVATDSLLAALGVRTGSCVRARDPG
jgi:hypothetical protein